MVTIGFPRIHSSTFITKNVINNLSLLYEVRGSDGSLGDYEQANHKERNPYMLTAHMDVVPVNNGSWRSDPFGGVLLDGNTTIYGRGAIDDKHSVMVHKN